MQKEKKKKQHAKSEKLVTDTESAIQFYYLC